MTRILYVHHGKGIGGAPLSLLYLIRKLDRERFAPTVLCLHESEAAELFRGDGIEMIVDERMHDFSHTNVLWYPWWQWPKTVLRLAQFPGTYIRARRFLASRRFDLVHLNTSPLTAFGLAARREGIPVVWHIREPLQRGYLGLRRAVIRRIIDRCADVVIPICRYDADQLLPSSRITVVYNFIDFAQWNDSIDGGAVRKEFGIPDDAPVALMLGGMNPIKGTAVFVEAALRVLNDRPDAMFLIAGPMVEANFRNRISGRTVYQKRVLLSIPEQLQNKLRFLGVRNDIPALLAATDVLCFPSTVPHFARPIIEASAMRVPVIASDLGGPQELVRHEETGLLIPAEDAGELARALVRLFEDPPYRERMGKAGRELAHKKFDADVNTRRIIELYEKIFIDNLGG